MINFIDYRELHTFGSYPKNVKKGISFRFAVVRLPKLSKTSQVSYLFPQLKLIKYTASLLFNLPSVNSNVIIAQIPK